MRLTLRTLAALLSYPSADLRAHIGDIRADDVPVLLEKLREAGA